MVLVLCEVSSPAGHGVWQGWHASWHKAWVPKGPPVQYRAGSSNSSAVHAFEGFYAWVSLLPLASGSLVGCSAC